MRCSEPGESAPGGAYPKFSESQLTVLLAMPMVVFWLFLEFVLSCFFMQLDGGFRWIDTRLNVDRYLMLRARFLFF